MRNLASVQRISALAPIEGADKIEVARVLGWNVVVKKGDFAVGDLVVYCEIDSVLPERPEFEFLRERKFRIKTCKLRGTISQGICFPLSVLPPLMENFPLEGEDVTEILGIVKYEPKLDGSLAGESKGGFPGWLPKTDETRIQSVPWVLEKYKGLTCYVAEKIDGSSFTCYLKDGEFHVLSRTLDKRETEGNAFWMAARRLNLEQKLRDYGADLALQGELIGGKIQGGRYKTEGYDVKFFNAFSVEQGKYVDFVEFMTICDVLGIETVPILNDNFVINHSVDELVEYANGKSQLNPNVDREGVVIRPLVEQFCHKLGRLSFKIISPAYLLKNEE